MPFKSEAQQKFMFAKHPRIAKRWADKMTSEDFKKLPEKAGKKKASVKTMLAALKEMAK